MVTRAVWSKLWFCSQEPAAVAANLAENLAEMRAKKEEQRSRRRKVEPAKITVYNNPKNEGEAPRIWSSVGAPQVHCTHTHIHTHTHTLLRTC